MADMNTPGLFLCSAGDEEGKENMVKKVNKNPLWRYAGSNWWRYLIGLTSLVMSVLFDIWFPLITMSIVDDVIIGGDMHMLKIDLICILINGFGRAISQYLK